MKKLIMLFGVVLFLFSFSIMLVNPASADRGRRRPIRTATKTIIPSKTPIFTSTRPPGNTVTPTRILTPSGNPVLGKYILLGWNDLGMHCYN